MAGGFIAQWIYRRRVHLQIKSAVGAALIGIEEICYPLGQSVPIVKESMRMLSNINDKPKSVFAVCLLTAWLGSAGAALGAAAASAVTLEGGRPPSFAAPR